MAKASVSAQRRTRNQEVSNSLSHSHLQHRSFAPLPTSRSQMLGQLSNVGDGESSTYNFAQMPLGPAVAPLQAKLTIGQPNDPYEQEADRVAYQVVRQINSPQLQQETEEPVQRQSCSSALVRPIMRRVDRAVVSGEASEGFEQTLHLARSGGAPLDQALRPKLEASMGADFSGVKVHTDTQADQLSQSIQARAFTTGQDVFFKQGEYNPSSRSGQELIAHELTHVVQQTGKSLQCKPAIVTLNEIGHAQLARSVNVPSIQARLETARVLETSHLHRIEGDAHQGNDKGHIGPKLKFGHLIEVDKTIQKENGWIKAKLHSGEEGFIRRHKVFIPSDIEAFPASDSGPDSTEKLETAGELSSGVSDMQGEFAGIVEEAAASDHESQSSLELTAALGDSAAGILGMVANAQKVCGEDDRWEQMRLGYGFVESTAQATSGSTAVVDSFAKALGHEDGVGESDMVGKYTTAVADGLSSVKSAAMGVIGLYRLYKSTSSEKGKESLVTFKQFTEAAVGAAKVAKSAYEIIGNGIPTSLVHTIPALGIAVSAINALIRLGDAVKAGSREMLMGDASEALRRSVAQIFGLTAPDDSSSPESPLFGKETRGTFPSYKTYFRIKPPVRQMVSDMLSVGEQRQKQAQQAMNNPDASARSKAEAIETTYSSIGNAADSVPDINSQLKETLKKKVNATPGMRKKAKKKLNARFANLTKDIQILDQTEDIINSYEFSDKMSEINQKRTTSGWTDVALELVSMSGDITTISTGITGVGAIVGQAIKASSAGYKLAHGSAKFTQKLYRDRGNGDDKKSTKNKHSEYVNHAKFIFGKISKLKSPTSAELEKIHGYIQSTKVNTGMFYALQDPKKQVEMLVEAMKER